MLVELPPLPRGKTATWFFDQWGSPSKFKAILKDSYGTRDRPVERGIGEEASFFVFQCSSGTAMRTTDRPTDPGLLSDCTSRFSLAPDRFLVIRPPR